MTTDAEDLTADTITDAQIRELRGDNSWGLQSEIDRLCLTLFVNNDNVRVVRAARARCAEMFNQRNKEAREAREARMTNTHEATEALLQTAREFGCEYAEDRTASAGDVVAAAYRLTAAKLREHGYQGVAKALESAAAAAQAEKAT